MTGGMASAFGAHGALVVPIARSVLRGESRRVTAAICPLAALAAGRNVRRGLETVPTSLSDRASAAATCPEALVRRGGI